MAVYTQVSEGAARRLLTGYALGELQGLQPILAGVSNTNYYLTTNTGRFVLTLFEKRVAAVDLPWFMEFMAHLARHGAPVPLPVANDKGEVLFKLVGHTGVILQCMPGTCVAPEDLTAEHCRQVGAALAQLHHAGQSFAPPRANDLSLPAWRKLAATDAAQADGIEPGLRRLVQEEIAYLSAHWPAANALPFGAIHADLFDDNVLFENGRLSGIIDFYFACSDFYAYDLAVTCNAWCFDANRQFKPECAKALVAAYNAVRPLNAAERAALPILLRGAAMRFLLTRLQDALHPAPDAQIKPKSPVDYSARLRFFQTAELPL